jgi:hypothetical protein
MATARDLERLLAEAGFSASRLDTANRKLRDAGRLPNAGRGLHAPKISAADAAAMLLAYCGSGKAVRAGERLRKLETLPSSLGGRSLLAAIRDIVEEPVDFAQLRVSRVRRQARIVRLDGSVELFAASTNKPPIGRFENEAVLDAQLLQAVSALLRGEEALIAEADEAEEGE